MNKTISGDETLKRTTKARRGAFWLGIGISAFFLFLTFRSINGAKLLDALRNVEPRFLAAAVASTLVSYYVRAYRWKLLLIEDKRASMTNLFSATSIGYMANNLLPARIGELVRVYVLGEKEGIDKGTVFASLVLDRLFDGFSVLLILVVTLFALQVPGADAEIRPALKMGGYVTVAVYLGILVFLLLLKRNTMAMLRFAGFLLKPISSRIAEKVIPLLGSFIKSIRLSSRPVILAGLLGSSFLIWAFAIWPIDLALRSFGIALPLTASCSSWSCWLSRSWCRLRPGMSEPITTHASRH